MTTRPAAPPRRALLPVVRAEATALAALFEHRDETAGRDAAAAELGRLLPDDLARLAAAARELAELAECVRRAVR